jgi:hypothetical protein
MTVHRFASQDCPKIISENNKTYTSVFAER